MIYMGVDPGASKSNPGAIAALQGDDVIGVYDIPVMDYCGKTVIDAVEFWKILTLLRNGGDEEPEVGTPRSPIFCVLEHTEARGRFGGKGARDPGPDEKVYAGDSAQTAFSMGDSRGTLRSLILLMGELSGTRVQLETPRPVTWKPKMGVTADKATSIARARLLFPQVNLIPPRCRTPRSGMAEALLLAEYGRRLHGAGVRA